MLILYTAIKCPKCPEARKVVREVLNELGLKEGKDFVEKLIDGENLKPGKMEIEGENYNLVTSEDEIKETPAALVGEDFTIEALTHQIATTPSLVYIDDERDEIIFMSDVPKKEELVNKLKSVIK